MIYNIIELRKVNLDKTFLLWGENPDNSYFLLDFDNKICGYSSLENLNKFLSNSESTDLAFDRNSYVISKELFINDVFDISLLKINQALSNNRKIEDINADDADVLLNFYNLMSDYFEQVNNEVCLLIFKKENMKMFFDYCYLRYFWSQGDEWLEFQNKLPLFDYAEFERDYDTLKDIFLSCIKTYA